METREARRVTRDIVFRKIGVDVPLSEGAQAFSGRIPARALAVSNRYGITFFVHSGGFVVTKTASLVEVAQQAQEDANGKTAQQGCYLDVPVPDVHILSLSRDELTLAVCAGDRAVELYDVPSLVYRSDKTPLESRNIPEGHVKDLMWCPAEDGVYFLLSREGQLFTGQVGENPKRVVDKGVVAASWSPDGKNIAYGTKDRSLYVASSKCEPQYSIHLPANLRNETDSSSLQVESLRWVRPDGMLVAYTQNNDDGEEEDCPLILLTSKNGDHAKEGAATTALVFDDLFPSIDSMVIPTGSGPYMLAEYLKPWEMAVAANRRSIDDHIVILGWFSEEDENEALNIELSNDSWIPRIELQENGDDNVLLGLAFDLTTTGLLLTDPRDDSGDTKLPACPVLMCLSLGGKLNLFSVARLEKSATVVELVSSPSALPENIRARQSSKASVEVATKPPQPEPASKLPFGTQQSKNRQAEERVDDEPSISSGSETDREDDQSDDDEVLSHFSASAGKGGKMTRAQNKILPAKESSGPPIDTSSLSRLQTPGASALSSLASTGASNMSSLSSVKSAPSGLNQLQATTATPQPPTLLTRTVTQVQPSAAPFSFASQSASFPSLSSTGLVPAQSSGPNFFGQASNDKGSRGFTPPSALTFSHQSSQLERGAQTGPPKITSSAARTPAPPPARPSGASEMEQTFIIELEKVKQMADEVDNLMAYIEGRSQKTTHNQPPCFTKQSLNELELGIRTLVDNCKAVKERVQEERQGIDNLRDENLQVDAWRIYVQSLAEQAAENRHQELWSRRKLAPDLDMKRKRVIKAEQELKQQIAALEEHVHHLELDNRKRHVSLKGGKNNLARQTSMGGSQSRQNLYSTVNGLLASADRLSQQVAQQMEALNISIQPATANKIMKSVGLSPDDSPHLQIRPSPNGTAPSPHARHRLTYSPSSKLESGLPTLATPPRRPMPSDSGVGAPSITRRRRDSMDGVQRALALVGGASPKTTIERVALHTPTQQLNPPSMPSASFGKHLRQRSSQESSEDSTSQPRHVRRVLSSQSGSASSRPVPSATLSTTENKASLNSGPSASSGVSSLQGSHSPPTWNDQQSNDGRPDPKRTVSRSNAPSFAEKSGPTLVSRFGPPPARTTPAPAATAVSTNSTPSTASPVGAFPSNPPAEGLFKWASNRSPTSASSFSFVCTPAAPKPSGTPDTAAVMPSGKPASSFGTTQPSSAGVFSSTGKSSTDSNAKLGVDANSKPTLESAKQEKTASGPKAASAGAPLFPSASFGSGFSSSSSSRPSMGGIAPTSSAPSTPFSVNFSGTKSLSQKDAGTEAKPDETKLALPLTPPAPPPSFNLSNLNKRIGSFGTTPSAAVSSTPPTLPAVPTPPAEKPSISQTPPSAAAPAPTMSLPFQPQVSQLPSSSLSRPASPPNLGPSSSPMGGMMSSPAPTPTAVPAPTPIPTPQFVFPATTSTPAPSFTVPSITTADPDEEDMEEEQMVTTGGPTSLGGFNLGGLGLGSTPPAPSEAPKTNLFGSSSPFGTQQTSPTFTLSSPQGQLFRPAAFSLPSQSPSQTNGGFGFGNPAPSQSGTNPFGSGFGGASANPSGATPFGTSAGGSSPGFGSPAQPGAGAGFGQRSQPGPGQQALGSALGAFGQTRQMGAALAGPFGSTPGGGFASAATGGGGFTSAATGGGFAGAATGGGFTSAATGGGFAGAAAGGGFTGAAAGGGFAGAAGASAGGFAGVTGGGGFQAFGGTPGAGGGFGQFGGGGASAFGSSTNPPAPPSLFTQMRK